MSLLNFIFTFSYPEIKTKTIYYLFISLFTDPRVKDWPMMSSPFPTIALCIFYAYFNRSLAPKFMANRKPFDLRMTLVIYNLFQTLFSAWIFYEVSVEKYENNNKKKKIINE